MAPELSDALAATLDTLPVSAAPREVAPKVFLMQATAGAFAAFAPQIFLKDKPPTEHHLAAADVSFAYLDALYEAIRPGSYVILDRPQSFATRPPPLRNAVAVEVNVRPTEVIAERTLQIGMVRSAQSVARRAYDLSSKSTRLELVRLDQPSEPLPVMPGLADQIPRSGFSAARSTTCRARK